MRREPEPLADRRSALAAGGLLALIFAVHWNALRFASIEGEDFERMFSGSGPAGLAGWAKLFSPAYFETFHQNFFYRPLATAFYRLGWAAFGARVEAYQAAKLLIVWGACAFLGALAVEWGLRRRFAFLAACLMGAGALFAATLTRLSFVDDPLAAFFAASALCAHAFWRRGRGGAGAAALWIGASTACAFLSKESSLLLPFILALQHATLPSSSPSRARSALLPAAAVAAAALVHLLLLSHTSPGHYGSLALTAEKPFWAPAARMARYLAEFAAVGAPRLPALAGLALLAALAATELGLGSPRRALFCLGWMVLGVVPFVNLVSSRQLGQGGYFAANDLAPWRLLFCAGGFALLAAGAAQALSAAGRIGTAAAVCLAAALLGRNIRGSILQESQDRAGFADELSSGSFSRPGYKLAGSRFEAVMYSLPFLRRSQPETFERVTAEVAGGLPERRGETIADLFSRDEIYDDTFRYARVMEALSHKGFAGFHRELARAAAAGRDARWAAERIGRAARLKDDAVEAFRRGDVDGAIAGLRRSRELNPDNLYTLISLGAAYMSQDRPAEALEAYDRAMAARHEDPELLAALIGARENALKRLVR